MSMSSSASEAESVFASALPLRDPGAWTAIAGSARGRRTVALGEATHGTDEF